MAKKGGDRRPQAGGPNRGTDRRPPSARGGQPTQAGGTSRKTDRRPPSSPSPQPSHARGSSPTSPASSSPSSTAAAALRALATDGPANLRDFAAAALDQMTAIEKPPPPIPNDAPIAKCQCPFCSLWFNVTIVQGVITNPRKQSEKW